jgi:hypothetical protein
MNAAHARFPDLDGWRTVAFLAVYASHGFGYYPIFGYRALNDLVFKSGGSGVSFFFVLSGFLITHLILSEIDCTGRLDVFAFYVRRCLRIWPLYSTEFQRSIRSRRTPSGRRSNPCTRSGAVADCTGCLSLRSISGPGTRIPI